MSIDSEREAAALREFLGSDYNPGKPAVNVETMADSEFAAAFLDGEQPDLDALARKAKADADAAEIASYRDFAKSQLESRGYDTEKHEWRKPELAAEESLVAAMPDVVVDEHGSPLVTPDRWQQFVDTESEMGALSSEQFSRLLAARESNSDVVFGPEPPQEHEVDDLYSRYMLGEKVVDAE